MNRDECNDPFRRRELRRDGRRKKVAGLASVEVVAGEGELSDLLVTFVGAAPPKLSAEHFHITGGRKPRPPQIAAVRSGETIGGDARVLLILSGEHDHSVYTLHLAAPRTGKRRPSVDPRHDRLDFVFDLACPPVDCASECEYEDHAPIVEPDIDYLAKDYGSFRRLMLDRLSLLLPEWTERHEADLGIMLVDLLAHVGDRLSYQQDAVATEAYVGTAHERISIRRHARLVDYVLHEGCNARAFVCVSAPKDIELCTSEIAFATQDTREASGEIFLPIALDDRRTLSVREALRKIEIYDWDGRSRKPGASGEPVLDGRECCLRRGTTSATLVLAPNLLAVGDFLIFEEVLGPRTGRESDADPSHRHVVRLTGAEKVVDPLEPTTSLIEVRWGSEDALPFDLCLSTLTTPPACRSLRNVSVARGNVVLVDHGQWLPEGVGDPLPCAPLGVVPLADSKDRCDGPGHLCDEARTADRFRPALTIGPITHRAPLPSPDPCLPAADALPSAHALLVQDPRAALPMIEVCESDPLGRGELLEWTPRQDLLRSGPADRHFVVEIDDDGIGWLRFGDGELGRHPEACASMTVRHRVGSGPRGNVGRDRITRFLSAHLLDGADIEVRNPLPASGGVAPEPLERAREQLAVPLRSAIQRAITAADYETIAEREVPGLQNASADLLWNGSWYEAHVALDPLGHAELDEVTRCRTERALERARRIGHDLYVGPARTVPLCIALHVCVEPKHLRASVRAEVLAVLGRGRLRDGSLGYFHPDRLTFGEPIRLSRMLARVAAIPGVAAVRVQRFERLFEGSQGELGQGYIPLARNEIARLDNDPVRPEHGILDVEVEGGR
jgi:hypothetical protein